MISISFFQVIFFFDNSRVFRKMRSTIMRKSPKNRGISKDFIVLCLVVAGLGFILYEKFDPTPQIAREGQTAQAKVRLQNGNLLIWLAVVDSKGTQRRYLMKENGRAAHPPMILIKDSAGKKIGSVQMRAG